VQAPDVAGTRGSGANASGDPAAGAGAETGGTREAADGLARGAGGRFTEIDATGGPAGDVTIGGAAAGMATTEVVTVGGGRLAVVVATDGAEGAGLGLMATPIRKSAAQITSVLVVRPRLPSASLRARTQLIGAGIPSSRTSTIPTVRVGGMKISTAKLTREGRACLRSSRVVGAGKPSNSGHRVVERLADWDVPLEFPCYGH
jgi:hypothetical protein